MFSHSNIDIFDPFSNPVKNYNVLMHLRSHRKGSLLFGKIPADIESQLTYALGLTMRLNSDLTKQLLLILRS